MGAGRMSRRLAWLLAGAAVALSGCGSGSGAVTAAGPRAASRALTAAGPGAASRALTAAGPGAASRALTAAGPGAASGAGRARRGDGVPASLAASARPIGAGPRFRPGVRSGGSTRPPACASRLGRRYGVHLELFAANRVVLLAPGIGLRRPWRSAGGQITRARCYGPAATLDPTGVVLVRPGARLTVGDVFAAWGRPLRTRGLLSFRARGRVRAYVDGRRWTRTPPAAIPLTRHAEIVLELGPYVPPHRSFAFPPGE